MGGREGRWEGKDPNEHDLNMGNHFVSEYRSEGRILLVIVGEGGGGEKRGGGGEERGGGGEERGGMRWGREGEMGRGGGGGERGGERGRRWGGAG